MTFPVYGCSSPAMIRRIVVFPLPDAPSNTSASPSATSNVMFSSTLVLPKRLLTPTTLVAFCDAVVIGAGTFCSSISFSFAFKVSSSIDVQPVACEEQHAENQKRKECQNDGNCV